tara:strand:- start:15919 stop:16440 length:522 start_codon:yes stop_codon:yes gene_type:complete
MKKILLLTILGLSIISIFTVSASAQSLYVDANIGDMKKIDDSKYKAQAYSVLRNSNGELISVVKTVATRYLDEPITDEFLDTVPVMKKGIVGSKNVEMHQVAVEYNFEKCLTQVFEVPGYSEQCAWYHRAFSTMLAVTDETGESYEIFRGLNNSYIVTPLDTVTSYWTIIRSD